jgi:zinc protease
MRTSETFFAQIGSSEDAARTAGARLRLGEVRRVELDNGLVVITRENPRHPLVSLELVVRAGSRQDDEEKAGAGALAGGLLDAGAGGLAAEEISDRIEDLGGALATYGGYSISGLSLSCASEDLETLLDLACAVLLRPHFDPRELEKEKLRVLADIVAERDNPRAMAFKRFNEMVFAGHPRHRPVEGYEVSVADVRGFWERHYRPETGILVCSGKLDSGALLDSVEARFGAWNGAAGEGKSAVPFPPPASLGGRGLQVERIPMPKEQLNIYLGHPGIARRHPDFYPLRVMDKILGQGFTSRLNSRLRDELGLAYSTFSSITSTAGVDPGAFVCYIGTAPEREGQAVEGILAEIRRLRQEAVPAEELRGALSFLTGHYIFGLESNQDVSSYLLQSEVNGLPLDHIDSYVDRLERITAEDVQRVARTHLDPENMVIVAAGPLAPPEHRFTPPGRGE